MSAFVLQVGHPRILGHGRLVLRCDDDRPQDAFYRVGQLLREHLTQQRATRDRIPFDQNQFIGHTALRQSLVVEAQRRGDAVAEVSSVVVVPRRDDDADKQ